MKLSVFCRLALLLQLAFFFTAFRPADNGDIKLIDYYGDAANSGKLTNIIQAEIKAGRTPVLFFTAVWCGPCKQF